MAKPKTKPAAKDPGKTMGSPEIPRRVVIENVSPEIAGGRSPVKRTIGEKVNVTADIHTDGNDMIAVVLRYRNSEDASWRETPMRELGNDRWAGTFPVTSLGRAVYGIAAWVDRVRTWRRGLGREGDAGQ